MTKNEKSKSKNKQTVYHDLDKLTGTWSEKDLHEFQKNTKDFEKLDSPLDNENQS